MLLAPETWFRYHDIGDVDRLHLILIEPVHYCDGSDESYDQAV